MPDSAELARLVSLADALVVMPSSSALPVVQNATAPIALYGHAEAGHRAALTFQSTNDPALHQFCRQPHNIPIAQR
jgi:hypothetical protein